MFYTHTLRGRLTALVFLTLMFILSILHLSYTYNVSKVISHNEDFKYRTLLNNIQNQTLGFQNVFAISLPSRTDRRDSTLLAASLAGFNVEFIDGVDGANISEKALPPGADGLRAAQKGCWRAHLNVWAKMIEENIATALVMEDDGDWDLGFKNQLVQLAFGLQPLIQPIKGSKKYYDPTHSSYGPFKSGKKESYKEFDYDHLPPTEKPKHSPYGDNWDLLWLGNCGTKFSNREHSVSQTGRVVLYNDPTAISTKRYDKAYGSDEWERTYPSKTRVYHHAYGGVCTSAYSITQNAARKLLYEFGIKHVTAPLDLQLAGWCDGNNENRGHHCYTSTPALIEPWRPKGKTSSFSDINEPEEGLNDHSYSRNIKYSAHLNMERLVEDPFAEIMDQYPDN